KNHLINDIRNWIRHRFRFDSNSVGVCRADECAGRHRQSVGLLAYARQARTPCPFSSHLRLQGIDLFSIIEEMTERGYLGEFELMVILTLIQLGDDAYGVPISRELERRRGRGVSVGSVYAALERLEQKGLVSSNLGDPTPERGGKA